jgi:hypothetical protein
LFERLTQRLRAAEFLNYTRLHEFAFVYIRYYQPMLGSLKTNDEHYAWWAFAFVFVNGLVWWVLFSVGRSSLDTYGDMAEAYSWGITWQWGYDKHPPLSAWTAAAWFQLFPTTDWAYYLLAMVNQGVAFWFVFLAGRRWLSSPKALLAVMMTSLIPLFGPDTGFKFNANSAMLPWLAIFAWSLIAALQTKSHRYVILAGFAGGLACLVKYSAGLMLVSITFGVLIITAQSQSLPWRMTLPKMTRISGVTLLCFVPHLVWAVEHRWPGLRYAHASHAIAIGASTVEATLTILMDVLLVALLPMLAWLLSIIYVRSATVCSPVNDAGSPECGRRVPPMLLGASIFVFALLLTFESAHLAGVAVATKWLIPAWLFFSWFLCCAIPAKIRAQSLILPVATMIGLYWAGLFFYVASINPSFSIYRDASNQRHIVASEATQMFHRMFGTKLRFVAGNEALAFSASFYSEDHPVAIANLDFVRTLWVNKANVREAGLVVLCTDATADCVNTSIQRLGIPQASSIWRGFSDDGNPATVHQLFYAPNKQRLATAVVASAPASRRPLAAE